VSFSLEYRPSVRTYLRSLSTISRQGRLRLFAMLDFDLREHGDSLLADSNRCINPEKAIFLYEPAFIDEDGDGLIHCFRVAVDAASAAFGVLRILYAEESPR
jgi:hypothetical protein